MSTPRTRADRFADVYSDVHDDVLRYVQRRTHPADHAQDVVADAMLIAWRRVDDLPDDLGDARAWVFGIARNCLLNDARSGRRSTALGVRLADQRLTDPTEPDVSHDVIARLDLAAAWQQLTDDEQDVIALTVLDGLTSAQAGAVLGLTPNAYRLRLTRARAALRRCLQGAVSRTSAPATKEMSA